MTGLRTHLLLAATIMVAGSAFLLPSAASAAGDANRTTCPNEANTGYSASLPDCRAYEQVSPAFKNGFAFGFDGALAGGERVKAQSFGAVQGATVAEQCALSQYDVVRTGSGWVTSAINDAPLSEFAYATPKCETSILDDAGASLLQLHPIAGSVYERDLYLHEPGPDGKFVPVGPMSPSSAIPPGSPTGGGLQVGGAGEVGLLAADQSLAHVAFVLEATNEGLPAGVSSPLWPGDTTTLLGGRQEVESLYEYVGSGNSTPLMVGVDNSGRLVSDCGTFPGGVSGGEGDHLNVMSADGSRVFFTARGVGDPESQLCGGVARVPPVTELLVRVNGGQPQSPVDGRGVCTVAVDACTVAVSEPRAFSASAPDPGCTSVECRADISEPVNFREANFEKASRDGSKVFFSSPQQLVDGAKQDPNPEDSAVDRGDPVSHPDKGCEAAVGANGCNLYMYDSARDPVSGEPVGLVLLSGAESAAVQPRVQGVAAVSEDGSHVYFVAKGELTGRPNPEGAVAEEGKDNLYVRDTVSGTTAFVATLPPTETEARQWTNDDSSGRPMNVTDDGRFLVFTSVAHLTAGDQSSVQQVFLYDAVAGTLRRVSVGDEGRAGGVGAASIASDTSSSSFSVDRDAHPAVSEDGAHVVFQSSEALVVGAADNVCDNEAEGQCDGYVENVYEYSEGRLFLIGSASPGGAPEISSSARDIFFTSTGSLVPQDGDTLADIYDARVGGGFAALPSGSPGCEGDACQGTPAPAPVFAAPGSTVLPGAGNLPPVPPAPISTGTSKRALSRAQRLARALRVCAKMRPGRARRACERTAKARFGAKHRAQKTDRGLRS